MIGDDITGGLKNFALAGTSWALLFCSRFGQAGPPRPTQRHLLEALVLGVVEEADGVAALGDACGLVVGRPRRGAAVAGELVAVGIVSERGADGETVDARRRVRRRRPRCECPARPSPNTG